MIHTRAEELKDKLEEARQELLRVAPDRILWQPRLVEEPWLFHGSLRFRLALTDAVWPVPDPLPSTKLIVWSPKDKNWQVDVLIYDVKKVDLELIEAAVRSVFGVGSFLKELRARYNREGPWAKDFLVLTAEGLPFWFPFVPVGEEDQDDTTPYKIIYADPLRQLIEYNTGQGRRRRVHVPCTTRPHPAALLAFLEDPPLAYLTRKTGKLVTEATWGKVAPVYHRAVAVLRSRERSPLPALYALGCALTWDRWLGRLGELRERAQREVPPDVPPLPPLFRADLRLLPHQAEALRRLAADDAALVNVDMGGGKTLLSLVDAVYQVASGKVRRPCVIVPKRLVEQYVDEVRDFTEGRVKTLVVDSEAIHREGLETLKEKIRRADRWTLVVTDYHTLQAHRLGAWLVEEAGVDMVTFDEAHTIKNPSGDFKRAAFPLAHAPVRRVMSGTFLSNTTEDLLIPFGLTRPNVLLGLWGKVRTEKYELSAEDVQEVRRRAEKEPGVLLYDRAAWIDQLPPRRLVVHTVEPDDRDVARMAEIIERSELLSDDVAETVLPIRRELDLVLAPKKAAKVREILAADDSPALVFCLWKDSVTVIARALGPEAATFWAEKLEALDAFKEGRYRVLVGVDKALKLGHNLQMARRVVRVEANYTWADEDQSFARVFRWGQKQPVELHFVFAHRSHDVLLAHNLAVKAQIAATFSKPWYQAPEVEELMGYTKARLLEALTRRVDAEKLKRTVEHIWEGERRAQHTYYAHLQGQQPRPVPVGDTPPATPQTVEEATPEIGEAVRVTAPPKPKKPRLAPVLKKVHPLVALNPTLDRLYYVELEKEVQLRKASLLEQLSRPEELVDQKALVRHLKVDDVPDLIAALGRHGYGLSRAVKAAKLFGFALEAKRGLRFEAMIPVFWGFDEPALLDVELIYLPEVFAGWLKQRAHGVLTTLLHLGFRKTKVRRLRRLKSATELTSLPRDLARVALRFTRHVKLT